MPHAVELDAGTAGDCALNSVVKKREGKSFGVQRQETDYSTQ